MQSSGEFLYLLLDTLAALLPTKLFRPIFLALRLPVVLALGIFIGVREVRVFADLCVGLLVNLLQTIGLNAIIDIPLELGLVALFVIVGKSLHVFSDVATKDVLAESLSVKLLCLYVVTRESAWAMRYVKTAVTGALHSPEKHEHRCTFYANPHPGML